MHIANWEWNRWSRSLQWQKACTAKLRHNPMSMTMDSSITQCCVPVVMTITGDNCMSEVGGSRRFWRNWYMSEGQQSYRTSTVRGCVWTNRVYLSVSPIGATFEIGWLTPVEFFSATFLLTSDELSSNSNAFIFLFINCFLWLSAKCSSSSWLCSNLRQFTCSLSPIDTWYCLSSASDTAFPERIYQTYVTHVSYFP